MGDCRKKGFESLSREHDRKLSSCRFHRFLCSKKGGFGIERVENGFDEQKIHATFYQGRDLLPIGCRECVEVEISQSGILHIGGHGTAFVRGPYRTGHESGFIGC